MPALHWCVRAHQAFLQRAGVANRPSCPTPPPPDCARGHWGGGGWACCWSARSPVSPSDRSLLAS
eukprot:836500-Alexandrium_andersonii.AAC.1